MNNMIGELFCYWRCEIRVPGVGTLKNTRRNLETALLWPAGPTDPQRSHSRNNTNVSSKALKTTATSRRSPRRTVFLSVFSILVHYESKPACGCCVALKLPLVVALFSNRPLLSSSSAFFFFFSEAAACSMPEQQQEQQLSKNQKKKARQKVRRRP